MLGDGAFWAPQKEYNQYLDATKSHKEKRDLVSHLLF